MPQALGSGLGRLRLGSEQQRPLVEVAGPDPVAVPEYLAYRVTDLLGNVVIDRLPHPHRSRWEVMGMQQATGGSSNVGSFEIPLYEPLSSEAMAAAADYAKLSYNQRIEGYLGDVIAGRPRFSGVIREVEREPGLHVLRGATWPYMLALQKTQRGEPFQGSTQQLAQIMSKNWQLQFADDFTGADLSGYTVTGTGSWQLVSAASVPEGLPSLRAHADASNLSILLTNQVFPQGAFDDCVFEAILHFYADNVPTSTSTSRACGSIGIVVNAPDVNTFTFGAVGALASGTVDPNTSIFTPSSQLLQAQISQHLGVIASSSGFISEPTSGPGIDYRCELQVQGRWNGSQYMWRVMVNGVDMGVTTLGRFPRPTAGMIGFFVYGGLVNGSGNALPVAYISNFTFRSRASQWFVPGNFAAATKQLSAIISRHSQLDLFTAAATTEGYVYRDTPGVGADTLDWAPAPGSDLTALVRFEEGSNLVDTRVEANGEGLATDIELSSGGTTDSASIHWLNIPAAKKYGILSDFASNLRTTDMQSNVQWAKQVALLKGLPGAAKTLTVLRDVRTADRWRELDEVTVHAPRFGLNNARVMVLGYTFVEGDVSMEVVGDQYPISMMDPLQRRWWSSVMALNEGGNLLAEATMSSPYDPTFGQPAANIACSGGVVLTPPGSGPSTLANLVAMNRDGDLLYSALLSFHIGGTLTAVINFIAGGVTTTFTNIGSTVFGAGDWGPFDITEDLSNNPGPVTIALVQDTGTGFAQSQVALYFPTQASV